MEDDIFFPKGKTTLRVEDILKRCDTFDQFEAMCSGDMLNNDCRTGVYILKLLDKYGLKQSRTSEEARMSTNYLGLIISGTRHPTRDMLIRVALAMHATVEETQYLLRYSGYDPLYARRKRDVIIWFGLSKGESLETVNNNIYDRGLEPLYTV